MWSREKKYAGPCGPAHPVLALTALHMPAAGNVLDLCQAALVDGCVRGGGVWQTRGELIW